jgi:hypothetical protein
MRTLSVACDSVVLVAVMSLAVALGTSGGVEDAGLGVIETVRGVEL